MRYLLLLIFWLVTDSTQGQGLNNLWMMGYDSYAGLPYGGTNIDFKTGTADISYIYRDINFSSTHSNITDANGDLLFFTNGVVVADRTGAVMPNGAGLNPSQYTTWHQDRGLSVFQADVIIPKPGDSTVYYLIHTTVNEPNAGVSHYLYATTIDMRLNNGLGDVMSKNQVLVQDVLIAGKITAVKHANGRDYWLFCHKANSATFYRFLITPDGIQGPAQQTIGLSFNGGGQACFSPDGSRFAHYNPWPTLHDLQLFDFDRCTGNFSNHRVISIQDSAYGGGVAFSPNSKFLYVSSEFDLYQYDVTVADIASSKFQIAHHNGFIDPLAPFYALGFYYGELASDGKIYLTSGNGSHFLHVINQPDSSGAACDFVQHGIQLPAFYFNTLPNHPNYHLSALAGSPCDTLLSATEPVKQMSVQLYPNPNSGEFSLSFAPQLEQGQLFIYDVLGKLVHQEAIAQWSQVKRVSLPQLPQGVYHSRLVWKGKTGVVRFVKH